ncbi:MAG TPA: PilN domain-containing protein [Tepidisphaeraceae bacterium]
MNAPNQLDFLPEDYLRNKAQGRTNVMCASLFVVMIVSIGGAFFFAERSMREAEDRHAVAVQQHADAARRIAEMKKMHEKQAFLARKAELSASLIDRVPRSYVLAELTNLLPAGVALTDLDLVTAKKAVAAPKTDAPALKKKSKSSAAADTLPPAPAPQEATVRLTGTAAADSQVAAFVEALKKSNLFIEVNLLISAEQAQGENGVTSLRRFSIDLVLDPKADVRRQSRRAPADPVATVEAK